MMWILITSDAGKKMVPMQQYLFQKYVGENPVWIDLHSLPLKDWCKNVLQSLEGITNEFVVFGLDDYLLTGKLKTGAFEKALDIVQYTETERFELGYAYKSFNKDILIPVTAKFHVFGGFPFFELPPYLMYPEEAIYSVSCQFSIWKTSALRRELKRVNGTPWQFETEGKAKAACFNFPVIEYIEEGALSKKWEGINTRGMNDDDKAYFEKYGML